MIWGYCSTVKAIRLTAKSKEAGNYKFEWNLDCPEHTSCLQPATSAWKQSHQCRHNLLKWLCVLVWLCILFRSPDDPVHFCEGNNVGVPIAYLQCCRWDASNVVSISMSSCLMSLSSFMSSCLIFVKYESTSLRDGINSCFLSSRRLVLSYFTKPAVQGKSQGRHADPCRKIHFRSKLLKIESFPGRYCGSRRLRANVSPCCKHSNSPSDFRAAWQPPHILLL